MSKGSDAEGNDPEPTPGTSGLQNFAKLEVKSEAQEDEGSTSDSEINPFSARFNPMKALYSDRIMLPVPDPPLYENLPQFEAALLRNQEILAVGMAKQVAKRERLKVERREAYEKALEDKNKQRFAKYEDVICFDCIGQSSASGARAMKVATQLCLSDDECPMQSKHVTPIVIKILTVKPERKQRKNVLTREKTLKGPLSGLRRAMQNNLRVKVVTRGPTGIRGCLHGDLTAFDKHWNMVLTNVLEIYTRKSVRKLKVPPEGGRPVPKGTADMIAPLPDEMVQPMGKKIFEVTRHIPQMLVRGEHVVLVNIVEQSTNL